MIPHRSARAPREIEHLASGEYSPGIKTLDFPGTPASSVRSDEGAVAVPDDLDPDAHQDERREAHQHFEPGLAQESRDVIGEAVREIDGESDRDHAEHGSGGVLGELREPRNARGLAAADGDGDRHRARPNGERHRERKEAADLLTRAALKTRARVVGPLLLS